MKITLNSSIYRPYTKAPIKNISFSGFECDERDFEVKRLYDIPCPCCSVTMIQGNQIDNFVSSIQNKTGKELIEILTKYQKYFHRTEKEVANILITEAKINADKNISELAKHYIGKKLPIIKQAQLEAINKLEKLSNEIAQEKERNRIKIICSDCRKAIEEGGYVDKQDLEKEVLKHIQGQRTLRKKVNNVVQNMPEVQDGAMLFLCKYANKTQKELASRLVTPSSATCEHIKPRAAGGENNTENYLAECEECNSKRNDTPFGEWVRAIPNFRTNLQNHIQVLAQKIQSGRVSSKYSTYLDDITKTISEETKGKVDIKAPTIEIKEAQSDINIDAKINQLRKAIDSQTQMLEELTTLRGNTSSKEEEYINEYNRLKSQLTSLEHQKQQKEEEIESKNNAIKKYYKKYNEKEALEETAKNYEKENHTARERNILDGRIKKLKNFLDSKNPEEMEEQLGILNRELKEIQAKIDEINADNRIGFLESQIVFPDQLKSQIRSLKAKLFEISEIEDKIEELQKSISKNPDIEEKIHAKEEEINGLLSDNEHISTKEDYGTNIETYKDMTTVLERIRDLKYTNQQGNKNQRADSLICQLAERKANEIIEELYRTSGFVHHKINLDKIAQLTNELEELNTIYSEKQERIQELEELKKKLTTSKTKEEISKEIEELTSKLKEVEGHFEKDAISERIDDLRHSIKLKQSVLEKLEQGNLSNEEIIQLLSQV